MIIKGIVVEGKKLGRKLGFPTANIQLDTFDQQTGVYLAQTNFGYAIVNIGRRPTVEQNNTAPILAEAFLLNHNGDSIYGEKLELELLHFIRPEKKFNSLEQLQTAIENDKKNALLLLKQLYNVTDTALYDTTLTQKDNS